MIAPRIAGVHGIVGALYGLAFPFVFGAMDVNYSHARDFISELGAVGAPNAALVSQYGFLPAGVLACAFALLAWRTAPRSALATVGFLGLFLNGVGYLGAAYFPCDAGCTPREPSFDHFMHSLLGLPGYFGAPVYLACLALAARGWPSGAWLSAVAGAGAVLAVAGLANMFNEANVVGLWQRVLEAGILTPMLAVGCYLLAAPTARRS
jgi:hypothetical protein